MNNRPNLEPNQEVKEYNKAYFQVLINFQQNNQAQLLPKARLAYNHAKNTNIGYTLFELNCRYHLCILYKEDLNFCSKSKIAKKLFSKL